MPLQPGTLAPDFRLPDQDGTEHTLSAHRGTRVLLYFYPKDDTPGCTTQACGIRDAMPELSRLDAIVFGISPDSSKSHRKFADKYGLPFTLLADEGHAVADAYGVWGRKTFMGREYDGVFRTSFLVGRDGAIERTYESVTPATHAADVLRDLAAYA
jgi:peroxiredoxin Q/BCP